MIPIAQFPKWLSLRARDYANTKESYNKGTPQDLFLKIIGEKAEAIEKCVGGANSNTTWKVTTNKRAYKLFRLAHGQDCKSIQKILKLAKEKRIIAPEIIDFDKQTGFVVSTWIDGVNINRKTIYDDIYIIRKIAEYQASMHEISGTTKLASNTNNFYLENFIFPRFIKWASLRLRTEESEKIYQIVYKAKKTLSLLNEKNQKTITNPDFTINNLVITPNKNIAIIDVEHIAMDWGIEFEIANFLSNLSVFDNGVTREYLTAYQAIRPLDSFYENRHFWNATVSLRRLGKQAKFFRMNYQKFSKEINEIELVLKNEIR